MGVDASDWTRDRLDRWLSALAFDQEDAKALADSLPAADRSDVWEAFEACRRRFSSDLPAYDFDEWPAGFDQADDGALLRAHVFLASLDALTEFHRQRGVPDDISRETIAALPAAMREHRISTGKPGLDATGWFVWLFRGSHYRVGRLTVLPLRLLTAPDPRFWYDDKTAEAMGVGFRRDDPVLSLHIPTSGPLGTDECDIALARPATAFDLWFPEGPPRLAICTSWTLDPQLTDYLPPESNLAQWQRRFTLVPDAKDSDFIMRFVFGERPDYPLDELPAETVLQRAVVAHLRRGRRWQVRSGWIDLQSHGS